MLWAIWFRAWPHLILTLLIWLIFGRALGGEFLHWDDTGHITLNPWLQEGAVGHFWLSEYFGLYIPLTYTVWTALFHLFGSAKAFHVFNLVLHTLNSFLVYALARKVLSSRHKDAVEHAEWGRQMFALIAAMIFAIHPFQVEPVAWISGGRDLLAAFFGLAAVLAAWNSADRLFPSWAAILRRVGATLLFLFGLLAKPSVAVLPLAVKWLSWFTERRGLKWAMMWVWLGLGALVGGLTLQVQSGLMQARGIDINNWYKPVVALDALLFYLRKFVVADFFSADYGRSPELVLSGANLIPAWPWLVLALPLSLGMLWLVPRAILGGLGFFVLMLAPVLGIWGFSAQTFSTVFDRYMYLPVIGLAVACASVVAESQIRLEVRLLLAALCLSYWAAQSFARVPVWRTNQALFENVLQHNPKSYNALVNLGIIDIGNNQLESAKTHLEAAITVQPRLAVAWANLAHLHWLDKNAQQVKAAGLKLQDPAFVDFNRFEPQALALLARMYGRVLLDENDTPNARSALCYARKLNPFDRDLENETHNLNCPE